PGDTKERLGLAGVCQRKKLHHQAAGLYAAAFAADPRLADDFEGELHRAAAGNAALAAAGVGEDAAQLDDRERRRLRKQALDWLRADLALRTRQLESDKPAERRWAKAVLRQWQQDADLAGVRDKAALAGPPAAAREAFTQLWADFAALLKKAEAPMPRAAGAAKPNPTLSAMEHALQLVKADLGPDHPGTLKIMHNLALAYKDAGKLDRMLPLEEEVL